MDWKQNQSTPTKEGGRERKGRNTRVSYKQKDPPFNTTVSYLSSSSLGKHTRGRAHTQNREREREMTPPANRRRHPGSIRFPKRDTKTQNKTTTHPWRRRHRRATFLVVLVFSSVLKLSSSKKPFGRTSNTSSSCTPHCGGAWQT